MTITKGDWFSLPLKLRERFWTETDYNRRPPSPELAAAMAEALAATDPKPPPAEAPPAEEKPPVQEPQEGEAA